MVRHVVCVAAVAMLLAACQSAPGKNAGPATASPPAASATKEPEPVAAVTPAANARGIPEGRMAPGVTLGGGDGSSREAAIVIHARNEPDGVAAEYAWLHANMPTAKMVSQSLLPSWYDVLEVELPSGEHRRVYFDISSFFGKM